MDAELREILGALDGESTVEAARRAMRARAEVEAWKDAWHGQRRATGEAGAALHWREAGLRLDLVEDSSLLGPR